MYTKQEIILRSYREGKSQRSISRELQISRKTIKKYIDEYEAYKQGLSNSNDVVGYLSKPPVYKVSNRSKIKLTREVELTIDLLLKSNEQKIQQGLRKQLLKKHDIYLHLQEQGYDIGYTTVCNYVRSKEQVHVSKEAYIRQEYQPGEECEFDWGEIKLYIAGKLTRLQLAVFTASYSNYRYALIFHRQDTLAFMESHASFFSHTGYVFNKMVYDNMRVAISKFAGKYEKEPTQALLRLRGHYQFSHRFCNFYRGNEKGHVERSVEYIRRKSFGFQSSFDTQKDAEDWLKSTVNKLNAIKQQLTGKTADEMFAEEKPVITKVPPKLVCSEHIQLRVDKYSTVTYRTNRYSVPDHLVGQFIDVEVLSNQIHIYENDNRVANHHRGYGKHKWIISIEHYLNTFKHKPGALKGSVALASSLYLKQLYNAYFQDTPRSFIELLSFCHKHQITDEKLEATVTRLLDSGAREISTEKIQAILGNKQNNTNSKAYNQTTQMAKEHLSKTMSLLN